MPGWKVAAVQMDVKIGEVEANLAHLVDRLHAAADQGARLVVFPECALSGYCYRSKEEAWPAARVLPCPEIDRLAQECARRDVHAAVGLLERGPGGELFNTCALVGPSGLIATYRKVHLPFLGVDRFTTPGDRPFAVHDLGGLRVGMNICYDSSFPEAARVLTLLGADLIVLPTNWPASARGTLLLAQARALENNVYFMPVDRIGEERGFRFNGLSRIFGPLGDVLAEAPQSVPAVLVAEIDPAAARDKRIVRIPREHEMDRLRDRRPDLYGPITSPAAPPPS